MKKLNLHKVEEKLLETNLKIFQPHLLEIMFGVTKRAAEGFLNYNTKKGAFIRLKPGLYSLKNNLAPDFFLANNLYVPSYISLDTALSYYNLIPETVYSVTSVTTKPTREFTVNNHSFSYQKIKKEAFGDYLPKEVDGQVIYLAAPEKAVADFLYFVYLGKRSFNDRLKLKRINRQKLQKDLKLFGQKRFLKFCRRFFND